MAQEDNRKKFANMCTEEEKSDDVDCSFAKVTVDAVQDESMGQDDKKEIFTNQCAKGSCEDVEISYAEVVISAEGNPLHKRDEDDNHNEVEIKNTDETKEVKFPQEKIRSNQKNGLLILLAAAECIESQRMETEIAEDRATTNRIPEVETMAVQMEDEAIAAQMAIKEEITDKKKRGNESYEEAGEKNTKPKKPLRL